MTTLPQLQAEEAVTAGSAGAVTALVSRQKQPPAWVGRQWSEWLRASKPRRRHARPKKATPEAMRAMGIGVRFAKKKVEAPRG